MLREDRIRAEDRLIRVRTHAGDVAAHLEMHETVMRGRVLPELREYLPTLDIGAFVADSYRDTIELLTEKLQLINDEIEEREIEEQEAKDKSGGLAA